MHKLSLTALLALLTWSYACSRALADADPCQTDTRAAAAPTAERPVNGYWSLGKPRFFISTRSELGTPYAKPYLSFGYGLPHWLWAGIDVNAILTGEFVQGYAGLRLTTPIFDLAFGPRDTLSFGKGFIVPAASVTRRDVLDAPGPKAQYWAWEGEAVAVAPLPHSALVADFVVVSTWDVPADRYVYEESYRAVVKNSLFLVLRTAAVARLLRQDALKLAVVAERVFATGRSHDVWRVGPAAQLQLTDHLEAVAALTLNVAGPDRLGLLLGAYGVAGIRYRWATGERSPALPWAGPLVP